MKALISGQAAVAVLLDGDQVSSFTWDDPDVLVPRRKSDLRLLFGTANDVVELPSASHVQAIDALGRSWSRDRAVHMALILLDKDTDPGTRVDAAGCFDEFLADPAVATCVTNLLTVAPLPGSSDLAGAIAQVESTGLGRAALWLRTLESLQPAIHFVRWAWDALPPDLFAQGADAPNPSSTRRRFEGVAARLGIFRRLAEAGDEAARIQAVLAHCLEFEPDLKVLPDASTVLRRWMEPLHEEALRRGRERQESLPTIEEALAADPRDAQGRRELSTIDPELGDDFAEGYRLRDRALEIAERLYVEDPGNPPLQRELTVALERVGDHRARWGDFAEVRERHQRALETGAARDQVEISPLGQLLDGISRLPEIRHERVKEVRRQLAAGTYETPAELELALDRMLDELSGW